jgi:hypothetical protein
MLIVWKIPKDCRWPYTHAVKIMTIINGSPMTDSTISPQQNDVRSLRGEWLLNLRNLQYSIEFDSQMLSQSDQVVVAGYRFDIFSHLIYFQRDAISGQ